MKAMAASGITYHYDEASKRVVLRQVKATITIDMGAVRFPFEAPVLKIVPEPRTVSQYDLAHVSFEDVMREHWHPSIKLVDIAERTMQFVDRSLMPPEEVSGWLGKRVDKLVREGTRPLVTIAVLVFALNIARALVLGLM